VRANLRFARNQPGMAPPALPGVAWARWTTRLTLNEWTAQTSVFIALFFAVLTARQIWPAWKKSTAGPAWMLAAACVCGLACLGLALDAHAGAQSSVVIVPEAVVRLGPDEKAASIFTAHDGAELLVLDRNNDWLEVADGANHKGWVPQTEVALAP